MSVTVKSQMYNRAFTIYIHKKQTHHKAYLPNKVGVIFATCLASNGAVHALHGHIPLQIGPLRAGRSACTLCIHVAVGAGRSAPTRRILIGQLEEGVAELVDGHLRARRVDGGRSHVRSSVSSSAVLGVIVNDYRLDIGVIACPEGVTIGGKRSSGGNVAAKETPDSVAVVVAIGGMKCLRVEGCVLSGTAGKHLVA